MNLLNSSRKSMLTASEGCHLSILKFCAGRMPISTLTLAIFLVMALRGLPAEAAVFKGELSDFEDDTTQGWVEAVGPIQPTPGPNPPTKDANGGPEGVGDNYLENVSAGFGAGGKMTTINVQAEWTGDYISAGVKKICAHVKVEATSDSALSLRAGFLTPANQRYGSLFPALSPAGVPNDGSWYEIVLPITPRNLVPMSIPAATYNQVMTNVSHFRIYHSNNASFSGAELAATQGLDNIRAWGSTGDLGGDCRSDIVWREMSTGQNWAYFMDGTSIDTTSAINIASNLNWNIVGNGDYDGNGFADLLWRNSQTGENWMYLMNGKDILTSSAVNVVGNLNWKVVGNGDYDGDGRSDILWRDMITGQNWMYLMNGTSIDSSIAVNVVGNMSWTIVGSGDYNGDGRSDILWREMNTGQNWVYFMNGNAITSAAVNIVANSAWQVAGNGDYDNDGMSDIFWRNNVTGQNWMYLMNGANIMTSSAVNTVGNLSWQVVGSGDYDGDGCDDILWREVASGENWIYLMKGAQIETSSFLNWVSNLNWEVVNVN